MIKLRFNEKKLIPDIWEYAQILISTMLVVYVFKGLLFTVFPFFAELKAPWDLVIIVFLVFYFKNLIDVKNGIRDYF